MKAESTHTRLESILERAFETTRGKIQVTGAASPLALAYFLSQTYSKKINGLPHLVVTGSHREAVTLQALLEFFDPSRHSHILPAFDVSPYSGLYPNTQVVADRVRFLAKAQVAKAGEIFISSVDALMQKTLPMKILKDHSKTVRAGDELPENLSDYFSSLGYTAAPMVEDKGQFAVRGGIVDIYPPTENQPVRMDLFGDQVESLRHFSVADQRSSDEIQSFVLTPAREVLYRDETHERLLQRVRASLEDRKVDKAEAEETLRSLVLKNAFPGIEFLLPYFYGELATPADHFPGALNLWFLDPVEISRCADEMWGELKADHRTSDAHVIRPELEDIYVNFETLAYPLNSRQVYFSSLEYFDEENSDDSRVEYRTAMTQDFTNLALANAVGTEPWLQAAANKLHRWRDEGYRIFVSTKNQSHIDRLSLVFEKLELKAVRTSSDEYRWDSWLQEQDREQNIVHIVPRYLAESLRLEEEKIIFLRDEDFYGKKQRSKESSGAQDFQKQAKRLSFGDLKPGDLVVHTKHGIGQYEGLKIMNISGVESEYIQVGYKDKDKLYLPVYRVGQLQKFSGAGTSILDKLGGTAWEKTKAKVKSHVRDIAADLLALYAKRAEMHRPAFVIKEDEVLMFDNGFPYEETDDQLRAINDIRKDLKSTKPMDRLVCGDVGFGKTEVAMRAAFFAIQARKQVAVLAPTTVLTFQHFETFKKRFEGWPVDIRVLNRFVTPAEVKKTLQDLKDGKVDLIVGTHKLLGSSIAYKDLGLLIIDEEQKFGVTHKEKIKKIKTSVDTLTLSATPIPRTLNMALVGIRDLSLINTAPVDRLPTRTFVTKFDAETIRKAVTAEISRGGQVYFIHNRIESIYGLVDELRQIVPEARIRVAHGQMEEHELEKAMLAFFHHEIDVLVCTAIVESGMDVPRANTMFIDTAHLFGLSQLYQLRGRVGRSKTRAYCYLMMPRNHKLDKEQQERLKIIQENTALGSGIKIAQYDLELRGSGNILGEEQSGHVNSVGYEMYMDLLNEALAEAKGESVEDMDLDPELNLKIPALIPDAYIKDIRIRLGYYKALADITSNEELDRIEEELRDQFGPIPEQTVNLMGLMLIRRQCKELGVRDISAGLKSISLIFTEKTKLSPEKVIQLAIRESKKYSLTPDNRLNIKMSTITWSAVHEEIDTLLRLI
ncbi:transcription-repair coupling factor [Bdellovibrio bacteriovorus]|uniref:Transcription-repair-coupling factor n=1 Tax=Bdellovibrio bacteriovorus str. Tiberius TaxID=1069642 RepID=K7ZHE3_BDEBC|nr:transcription-repair coupling factor [Bdellovibrio bacteriovorus]AFY03432.1 transcription-repair coupling factor [Bdellovibrio bacteriovorus str. Tiberius]